MVGDMLKKMLPLDKSFSCSSGATCSNLKNYGPFTLPSPIPVNVTRTGDLAPAASASCHMDIYLDGALTFSFSIGSCCGK
jgi:hypothetical protein